MFWHLNMRVHVEKPENVMSVLELITWDVKLKGFFEIGRNKSRLRDFCKIWSACHLWLKRTKILSQEAGKTFEQRKNFYFSLTPRCVKSEVSQLPRLKLWGNQRKLSAKALWRREGWEKYEKLRHLLDGKLCSSLLQIRDENSEHKIFFVCCFVHRNIICLLQLGKHENFALEKSGEKKLFLCIRKNVKKFISVLDKNVKRGKTSWVTSLGFGELHTNIYVLIIQRFQTGKLKTSQKKMKKKKFPEGKVFFGSFFSDFYLKKFS